MSRLTAWVSLVALVACAAGTDDEPTSTSSSGGSNWSTSNNGGNGPTTGGAGGELASGGFGGSTINSGGAGNTGGFGGDGSTGGMGGMAATGGMGGEGGGPLDEGRVVLAATAPSGLYTGAYEPSSGWTTTLHNALPSVRPSIAMSATDEAMIVFRNNGNLAFSTFSGVQFNAPVNVGAGVTTQNTPSIAATSAARFALFHGDDFKHYLGVHTNVWNPLAEPVGGAVDQSFGPSPGSICVLNGEPVIVFAGNNHDLFDQRRVAGVWQSANPHNLGDAVVQTPAIAALDQGAELLVVFVHQASAKIQYTTRVNNVWSAPADVSVNALTNDPVSVAPMSQGRAVVAYRGQNGGIFASIYDPASSPIWSAPVSVVANKTTPSTPSVARGIGAADAELAYADSTGVAVHVRLASGARSAPQTIGGTGVTAVAIASSP